MLSFIAGGVAAQDGRVPETETPLAAESPVPPAPKPPSAEEVMRERLSKAKAYLAVRNYAAAIYELENIRRESGDPSVNSVAGVLLMNGYLEQGDYSKASEILAAAFKSYKSNNAHSADFYAAIAGQIVRGSRGQIERYRSLGLSVSDRNLPLEAVNDAEQMRALLETLIAQAREMSIDKGRSSLMMPLLEEAVAARGSLGRDDYDTRRWRDEMADTRELLVNSHSVILSAVGEAPVEADKAARAADTQSLPPETPPMAEPAGGIDENPAQEAKPKADPNISPPGNSFAPQPAKTADRPVRIVRAPASNTVSSDEIGNTGKIETVEFGPLVGYALKQFPPVYPAAARNMRTSGVVRVEIIIDENGEVAEVRKTSGPALLLSAARDAIKKWKFKPFTRDGRPIRASGFVNFNFTL